MQRLNQIKNITVIFPTKKTNVATKLKISKIKVTNYRKKYVFNVTKIKTDN